jgi:hypothetical protein
METFLSGLGGIMLLYLLAGVFFLLSYLVAEVEESGKGIDFPLLEFSIGSALWCLCWPVFVILMRDNIKFKYVLKIPTLIWTLPKALRKGVSNRKD